MHEVERKLQKKDHEAPIWLVDMPNELEDLFESFASPIVHKDKHELYVMIMVFGTKVVDLQRKAREVLPKLSEDGLLWICYPKKSSKRYKGSNCGRNEMIGLLADEGYETVRQVAVSEDWSALRYRNASKIKKMKRSFAVTEEGKKKVNQTKEKS